MSNHEEQLTQVAISIEQAKEAIELSDALARLHKNKDFKLVITEGLFQKEATRAVLLRADPEMQTESEQKQVNDIITSIGGVYAYFGKTYAVGYAAKQSIVADEETRGDILLEQLGEENL
jgi:hypothetical protein